MNPPHFTPYSYFKWAETLFLASSSENVSIHICEKGLILTSAYATCLFMSVLEQNITTNNKLSLDIQNLAMYSVQFSPLINWVTWREGWGTWGTIQQISSSSLFCRRPLWAVLAWAGMSTLWCCPHSISTPDHGIAHPPRYPEGWFWRGCCGALHAWTMQVSISLQLPEVVHVDPQESWSCSAPSHWLCSK